MVLLAQELGLNTCWAGTFNRKNVPAEIGTDERLVIVIAIGYGQNSGKQCKSKSIEKVTSAGEDKGGPFSKIDLGIVKYHFEVGAEYFRENK